ncbi:hypothetical protein ACFWBR_35055 [Streptomyces sp. NPDC060006]|uniref:hypothetical protein n=1 Tax=unclassified Streptomyces TaxID=2593676 RepID=UPI0036BBA07B
MTDSAAGPSDPLTAAREKAFEATQRLRIAEDIRRDGPGTVSPARVAQLRAEAEEARGELADAEHSTQTDRSHP